MFFVIIIMCITDEILKIPVENHPLEPFLPANAKLLMLGSFPPPKKRWSMDFFYPNLQNDMWRILGQIYYGERDYFIQNKKFNKEQIVAFCNEIGLAIFDTAVEVRRMKSNASDKFLEIIRPTDILEILEKLPNCKAIVTTGEKATQTLCENLKSDVPKINNYVNINIDSRIIRHYRLPSSSRAYPLAFSKKVEAYGAVFGGFI